VGNQVFPYLPYLPYLPYQPCQPVSRLIVPRCVCREIVFFSWP
jgi:hypothetical protein